MMYSTFSGRGSMIIVPLYTFFKSIIFGPNLYVVYRSVSIISQPETINLSSTDLYKLPVSERLENGSHLSLGSVLVLKQFYYRCRRKINGLLTGC